MKRGDPSENWKGTYLRLAVSYLLVLLIPVLLVMLLLQGNIMRVIGRYADSITLGSMESVKAIQDDAIHSMQQMSLSIFINPLVENSYDPTRPVEAANLQRLLRSMLAGSDMVEAAFLYCHGDGYLFSQTSSYSLRMFMRRYRLDGLADERALARFLTQGPDREALFTPDSGLAEYILFVYRKLSVGSNQGKTMVYALPAAKLLESADAVMRGFTGCWLMEDKMGRAIAYSLHDPQKAFEDYQAVLAEAMPEASPFPAQTSVQYRKDGEHYTLLMLPFQEEGFRNVVLLRGVPQREIADLQKIWYISFISAFTVGLGGAWLMLHRSYRPIKTLVRQANTLSEENRSYGSDAFQYISLSLNNLNERNHLLSSQVGRMRDFLLQRLLRGDLLNEEECLQFQEIFAITGQPAFRVFVWRQENEEEKALKRGICDLPHQGISLIRVNMGPNRCIWILWGSMTALQALPLENFQADAVCAGEVYASVQAISFSYMEAVIGVEAGLRQGAVGYAQLCAQGKFNAMLLQIPSLLVNQDKNGLIQTLMNLISSVKEEPPCLTSTRLAALELLKLLYRHDKKRYCNAGLQAQMCRMLELVQADAYVLFFKEEVQRHFIDLVACEDSEAKGSLTIDAMTRYLKENGLDVNFSQKQMADHFSVSPQELSVAFKQVASVNLSDFVIKLRMDEAKRLLRESTLSVAQVGMRVGFDHPNSFNRRFKQLYKETPGQYRHCHRDES